MRIIKISNSEPIQVHDQAAFMTFRRALSKIKWGLNSANIRDFWEVKSKDNTNGWLTVRFGTIDSGNVSNKTPEYVVNIFVLKTPEQKEKSFRVIVMNATSGKRIVTFSSQEGDDVLESGSLQQIMAQLKITDVPNILPINKLKDMLDSGKLTATRLERDNIAGFNLVYGYKRLTKRQTKYAPPKALEIWIEHNKVRNVFSVVYVVSNPKTNEKKRVLSAANVSLDEAIEDIKVLTERALANDYVDQGSIDYIPDWASTANWDFERNSRKKTSPSEPTRKPVAPEVEQTTQQVGQMDDIDIDIAPEDIDYSGLEKISQTNYDFGGYYSGNIPDPSSYVGTSAVEAGQVKSAFGGADQAIQLVNQFNSSLLKNIAFIFNFNKSGAYGVYLSELDRAIKTEVLKKQLGQQGYKIGEENGMLTAFPSQGEIDSEKIQQDIDQLYSEIKRGGGTAIGINVGSILAAAREDANNIQSSEPEFLFQQLAILHLGETIVHEAIHAKGHMDEGPSEEAEAAFAAWALPTINKNYFNHLKSLGKEQEYQEIIIGTQTRRANNWYHNGYRQAQSFITPFVPVGSDLSGRMQGKRTNPLGGRADYSMVFNQNSHSSIEQMLGRQFMWPLAEDINPDKDSLEEQLRKTFTEDHYDPNSSTEELLEKDRALESELYKSIQEKLQDLRPAPLMQTIKATASMIKTARTSYFGYMNGLETDGGNNIGPWLPQPEDRVIDFDNRTNLFQYKEDTGRAQDEGGKNPRMEPRYNPETKDGIYQVIYEPRNAPQSWDEINRDNVNTHPAKRFAFVQGDAIDEAFAEEVLKHISRAKEEILSGRVRAARFLMSENLMSVLTEVVGGSDKLKTAFFDNGNDSDSLCSAWISVTEVSDEEMEMVEKYFRGDDSYKKLAIELLNLPDANVFLNDIIERLKKLFLAEDLNDIYLVGEAAREKFCDQNISGSLFRFCCEDRDDAATYGHLLAEETGKDFDYDSCGDLFIVFGPFKIFFHCGENEAICEGLVEIGAAKEDMLDGVKCELSNKDFTINMVALNLGDMSLYDPFNVIDDIRSKTLKTKYPANLVIDANPTIIVKFIKFVKEGYTPEMDLQYMVENCMGKLKEMGKEVLAGTRLFMHKNRIISDGE